eukprot:9639016-Heterocapsa_arctica.AAC.1
MDWSNRPWDASVAAQEIAKAVAMFFPGEVAIVDEDINQAAAASTQSASQAAPVAQVSKVQAELDKMKADMAVEAQAA